MFGFLIERIVINKEQLESPHLITKLFLTLPFISSEHLYFSCLLQNKKLNHINMLKDVSSHYSIVSIRKDLQVHTCPFVTQGV